MKINHELPIYDIVINPDDETGMQFISLVDNPAIEMKGFAFKNVDNHPNCKCEIINGEYILQDDACELCIEAKQEYSKKQKFSSIDKQIIVGPAMIPNKLIARKDDDGSKYYVKFSENVIRQLVDKFMKQNDNKRINIDHSNTMVEGYIQQSWIVEDTTYDKSRFYGLSVPKGTWMIEVKVEDTEFWNKEVKDNGKFGFSIEGILGQKLVRLSREESIEETITSLTEEEIIEIFKNILS